ncbi:NADH-quinone oxidoreductase subunit N [bacterium]|nr:NADH-quinone oxidoreductase subunit N [bacterium]MBU1025201.1 NADH-quinone oxidoreductase subunit N [bacterium]
MNYSGLNTGNLLPEILLFILACIILITDLFISEKNKRSLWDISFFGLLVVLFTAIKPFMSHRLISIPTAFAGQAFTDELTIFLRLIIISALFASLIFSYDWVNRTPKRTGIFLFLMIICALGGLLLANAGDLIVMVIGLEILSLPLYVLAGFQRENKEGREASFKYFILGSFASAFLLLGIALIFGAFQSTSLIQIFQSKASTITNALPVAKIGSVLIISALAFKGGLMPFYAWIPDVYRGSPDYIVGFMASVAKVAVFGTLIRISLVFFPVIGGSFLYVLEFLYIATVILGNLMALWQNDIKRMLAYSSIAHAGYLLLGIMAHGKMGFSAIIFYLLIYSFTVMGSFIITGLVKHFRGGYTLSHFDGLYKDHPIMALLMTIFMFTLAGIPPFAGFWSKLFLFNAAVSADFEEFAVIGVLASILGVYYYIRVMVRMYMNPAPEAVSTQQKTAFPGFFTKIALFAVAIIIIVLGFFPGAFYDSATVFMSNFIHTFPLG